MKKKKKQTNRKSLFSLHHLPCNFSEVRFDEIFTFHISCIEFLFQSNISMCAYEYELSVFLMLIKCKLEANLAID